jgi:hypothetical protein
MHTSTMAQSVIQTVDLKKIVIFINNFRGKNFFSVCNILSETYLKRINIINKHKMYWRFTLSKSIFLS